MEEIDQYTYRKRLQRHDGVRITLQVTPKNLRRMPRKVKGWSGQEDRLLLQLYEDYPKKWGTIASRMKGRNQNQCLHRFRRLQQLDGPKKIWSEQQDEKLQLLMKKVGKNWKVLAELLGTKTGKQIRERFINKLDPQIAQGQWSQQQDRLVIELHAKLGKKWSQMSKHLSGRPQNKIKNRFYSFIQKNYDIRQNPVPEETGILFGDISNRREERYDQSQLKSIQRLPSIQRFPSIQKFPSLAVIQMQQGVKSPSKKLILSSKELIRMQSWPASKRDVLFNQIQEQGDENEHQFFYLGSLS